MVNRRLPRGDLLIKIPDGDPTQNITKLDRHRPNRHQESWSCSHQLHRSYEPVRHPQQPGPILADLRLSGSLRSPLRTSRVASISLYTRATVTTPAEWRVAYVARFTSHVSLPLLSLKVGFRIILFEACPTFTARCGPRVRRVTSRNPLRRRLRPSRYLHDRSDGYRLERQLPGGSIPH